ncbi:MAG TPA: PH domain-containing protein [Jatrophihabitans sp.]|nr:PH domain-containing protein [Jatrophihabitans sp.]
MSTPSALRDPANLVSPRAIWYWTTRALIFWLAAAAVFVLCWLGNPHARTQLAVAGAILLAVALLHLGVMPRWRFRVHRWEATETAVYTRSGWFNQQRRIAPLSRIQTVDTDRGPLEQLFRLANVTVTTASAAGPVRIRGLDPADADRLVAELTRITAETSGDAT